MRRILGVAVLAAAALLASCSDSKKDGSISTVTFAGSSSSAPSSSPTTLAATTTVGATPTTSTAAPTTTSTLPVTTAASAASPDLTAVLPSNISPPTTFRDRSSSPDDPKIFETYKASWDGYVWTASHPDDPRWDWIDKTIEPSNRKAWRQDIEDHWAKGQILNADLGITVNPHIFGRTPRVTNLFDCRTTGLYWADRTTGQPVEGEVASSRLEGWYITMLIVDGKWYTAAAGLDSVDRRVTECGA